MNAVVKVLLIEDSEEDEILIERQLRKDGLTPHINRVWTESEMEKALEEETWDVILCDYMLPTFSTENALKLVRRRKLDCPFIIVSGAISEEIAVKMMKAGVHDYLKKDNLARLTPAIKREIKEAEGRKERERAEQALLESERKYRLLVSSISDIVFVIDGQGWISEFYSKRNFTLGDGTDGIANSLVTVHVPETVAAKFRDAAKSTIASGIPYTFDYALDTQEGLKWFLASLSQHEDRERAVVIVRDVSELKSAEENLRASKKIADLYLDILGHDIRNLLQAIKIGADLLGYQYSDLRELRVLQEMNEAIERSDEIISSVQGTGDLLHTPLEPVLVQDALARCIRRFRQEHEDVKVEADCRAKDALVNADKFIEVLLTNLLDNAVSQVEKKPHVWVKLSENEERVELSVADDGPGIRDELKEILFDPNRRFGGVGIHVVRQIAEKYGGTVEVHDRIQGNYRQGSEFVVRIPKVSQ